MRNIYQNFAGYCCLTILFLTFASVTRAQTIFADASRPDNSGDGLTWATAKKDLQVAVNMATAGSEVWVKGGTYYPTVDPFGNASPSDPNDRTFRLAPDVKIYGGFAGTETMLSERNLSLSANKSILNGDLGVKGNVLDNAYHVVLAVGPVGSAELNGFSIINGSAYNIAGTFITVSGETIFRFEGGGITLKKASPILDNLIISNNYAVHGGGIQNDVSSPIVRNTTITNNTAQNNGGGTRNLTNANARFINCIITANKGQFGGGMSNENSATITMNVYIAGNSASVSGGGMNNDNASPVITNTVITGNTSKSGGALYNRLSSPVITNTTISGNNATANGGAVYANISTIKVSNSIIYNNNTGIYIDPAMSSVINRSYSLVQGYPEDLPNGNADGNNDPMFTAPLSPGLNAGGNYTLNNCSPAINAGKNSDVPVGVSSDIAGGNRIQFDKVDMGAFESIADPSTAPIASAYSAGTNFQSTNSETFYANHCNELIAKVSGDGTGTSAAGNMVAKVWIEPSQPDHFVKRHYEISPDNNAATATGTVTLYFTQQEFDEFNADETNTNKLPSGPSDVMGIENLLVEKRSGLSADGTGMPLSYSGSTLTFKPTTIFWNSATNYWEISFKVTGFSGFFIKTITELLPVRWVSFTGKINSQKQSQLSWKAEEYNTSVYQVEKSTDGKIFSEIGVVKSKGNGVQNYTYTDAAAVNGVTYFRIKQIDKDGRSTVSSVIKVSITSTSSISVYPNPASNILFLTGGNELIGSKAVLTNGGGQKLIELMITGNNTRIDISRLAKGIFFLKLADGTIEKVIKE